MDEEFIAQVIAELKTATGQAFVLLTMAIAAQVDATKLAADLRKGTSRGPRPEGPSQLAIDLLAESIQAADVIARIQQQPKKH